MCLNKEFHPFTLAGQVRSLGNSGRSSGCRYQPVPRGPLASLWPSWSPPSRCPFPLSTWQAASPTSRSLSCREGSSAVRPVSHPSEGRPVPACRYQPVDSTQRTGSVRASQQSGVSCQSRPAAEQVTSLGLGTPSPVLGGGTPGPVLGGTSGCAVWGAGGTGGRRLDVQLPELLLEHLVSGSGHDPAFVRIWASPIPGNHQSIICLWSYLF